MKKALKIEEIVSNPSAERAILSLCLKDKDCLIECSGNELYSEHFAVNINKTLYAVVCYLAESQGVEHFDSSIVYSTIQEPTVKEELDKIGGRDYIDSLLSSSVLRDNLKIYINQVKACSIKRLAYHLGQDIQSEVIKTADEYETTEMVENIQKKVLNLVLSNNEEKEVYKMGSGAEERLRLRAETPRDIYGLMIGWKKFDRLTQGLAPNDLIVLVAPSKTGKSTWLSNIGVSLSVYSGLSGLYVDTEMTDEEQEDRLIAILSGVPFEEIRNGKFAVNTEYGIGTEKATKVYGAVATIKSANLFHVYMPDFNVNKVTALIRKYKIQEDISYCIFDYIKLPNGDVNSLNTAQEHQRLGYFTTCLKDLAGICNIPVITACQSNRSNVGNTDPDESDIGGSYRILQLATKLMFLRNKTDYEMTMENYAKGNQKLHIKFQRNGAGESEVDVQFDRAILRMQECS